MERLGAIVNAILAARSATRSAPHTDASTLRDALLAQYRVAHPAVLVLEERYGGLELFGPDEATASLVVGAHALATLGVTSAPRGDDALLLVAKAWDDVDYYVGRDGRGWVGWPTEPEPIVTADDVDMLIAQAVLWRRLAWSEPVDVEGDADHAASERGLASIAEATSALERWWGDADVQLVEIHHEGIRRVLATP